MDRMAVRGPRPERSLRLLTLPLTEVFEELSPLILVDPSRGDPVNRKLRELTGLVAIEGY